MEEKMSFENFNVRIFGMDIICLNGILIDSNAPHSAKGVND
jgi:hypothetical protein